MLCVCHTQVAGRTLGLRHMLQLSYWSYLEAGLGMSCSNANIPQAVEAFLFPYLWYFVLQVKCQRLWLKAHQGLDLC